MLKNINLCLPNASIFPLSTMFTNIYRKGGNIMNSQIYKTHDSFLISMNIRYYYDKKFPIHSLLPPMYKELTTPQELWALKNKFITKKNYKPIYISLQMTDYPGIIHNSLQTLTELNADLYEFNSDVYNAPICGTNVFGCSFIGGIPSNYPLSQVFKNFEPIEEKYNCESIIKLL